MLANARSLEQKMASLLNYINAYELSIALVTETWIKRDGNLSRIKEELELNKGLVIHEYCRPGKRRGGGVCIISDPNKIKLTENKFARKGHEVISVKGKIKDFNKNVVIYCIYLPPNISPKKAEEASNIINEDIARVKLELSNPVVLVGGDY